MPGIRSKPERILSMAKAQDNNAEDREYALVGKTELLLRVKPQDIRIAPIMGLFKKRRADCKPQKDIQTHEAQQYQVKDEKAL